MLTLRWLDLRGRGIRTVADGERSGLAVRTETPGATTAPPLIEEQDREFREWQILR